MVVETVTPDQLIAALRKIQMRNLVNNAASIIADSVQKLDGIGTHSPYTMAGKWNSLFDNVKKGTAVVDVTDVTSSRWNKDDAFFMDDASESQMLSNVLHGNTVDLADVKVHRDSRFVLTSKGAQLIKDPHEVDYVLCHIKGYKKYRFARGYTYIKGRDVIVSGTLLAVKEIIDMMKSEIEKLIKAEL